MSSLHDGSRPQLSHISDNSTPHPVLANIDRLGKHTHAGPAYFAATVTSAHNPAAVNTHEKRSVADDVIYPLFGDGKLDISVNFIPKIPSFQKEIKTLSLAFLIPQLVVE